MKQSTIDKHAEHLRKIGTSKTSEEAHRRAADFARDAEKKGLIKKRPKADK